MPEKFSASQASKFMRCHAAANLEEAIPNWVPPAEDPLADNAANRGTVLHSRFADIMALSDKDRKYMIDALEYVRIATQHRRFKKLIEQPEQADWLPSRPWTTADLVMYLQDELHIFDLKTGKIPVDPTGNDQLLFYAATYHKYAPLARKITLHIVQPWAGILAGWEVTEHQLFTWMAEAIEHDDAITNGDTTFMPGDHCLFCPANPHSRAAKGKPLCPAMMQMLYPQEPMNIQSIMEVDSE